MELEKSQRFEGPNGPVLLIIMDGVGLGEQGPANAFYLARTPNLDNILSTHMIARLKAHGTAVGLPSDKDMGNSEVGHNALGAGRVFAQGARLVNQAIESKKVFNGRVWKAMLQRCGKGGTLHMIGLLSDGNVHSHIDHLFALVKQAAGEQVGRLRIHALLDGRDVEEKSALKYIDMTEHLLSSLNRERGVDYRIASGGGRMVTTMDRYEADWSVVERGWKAHVLGQARRFGSAREAVGTYYREDPSITDQYLPSFVVADESGPVGSILDGDCVLFFNFRGDRAIEISRAFEEGPDFDKFDRVRAPDVLYAGMMEYDGDTHVPKEYLVEPPAIDRTISEYLCAMGITSFAVAETQKFGHVTYFWNGNRSGYIDGNLEKYIEVPSDKMRFDEKPEMKAFEVAREVEDLLVSGNYKWGRVNFANGDMVGHTGVLDAAIKAMEAVDTCVGRLVDKVIGLGGVALVTADHGNCEIMFTERDGRRIPFTAHTLNPVPFAIVDSRPGKGFGSSNVREPGLANVAATLLNILGYEKVKDYEDSLIG
ncbi:MAG: 2,3-bisphosphoglycerate-independent phosphoglycerate mutase [Deltaproteobacteria bacterium]|nr:2,3-bisphosphoglycerate-independent phosphoglycerate mutase [Deltaproteobacteria bacterium]